MIKYSEPLYRDIFVKTGGFMLNWPFGRQIKIGDFFALRPGNIGVVGNIYDSYFQLSIKDTFDKDIYKFQAPVLEPYLNERGGWEVFKPEPHLWKLRNGCTSNYSSSEFVREHKRKIVAPKVNAYSTNLNSAGDFFFVSNDTKYLRMPHFRQIHKELIRRLTTEFYNFNKIYLVTEVAHVSDFSLGISRTENAELITSREEYFYGDIVDILAAKEDFTVQRVEGFDHLILNQEGGAIAFKAMKMGLSVKAKDILTQEIYNSADKEIRKYAVELIDNELFHLFPKIEINPANANEFFSWSEMALEDIEIFFGADLS